MKKWWILSGLTGGLLGLVTAFVFPPQRGEALTTDREWNRFRYKVYETRHEGELNVEIPLTRLVEAKANTSIRVLLHYQSEKQYVAVSLKSNAVEVCQVQQGLVTRNLLFPAGDEIRKESPLLLKWRPPFLTGVVNHRQLFTAQLDSTLNGQVGTGVESESFQPGVPLVTPVRPIAATDDFMRGKGDDSPWIPADASWEVRSLDNPSRSANAFIYQCLSPKGSLSFYGNTPWDNLTAGISVKGPRNGQVGLMMNATGPGSGLLLRWFARPLAPRSVTPEPDDWDLPPLPRPQADPLKSDRIQLVLLEEGRETVLEERPGGYRPGQWYRVEGVMQEGVVRFLIDGEAVFQQGHPLLTGGRVGLFAQGEEPAEFDDFSAATFHGRLGHSRPQRQPFEDQELWLYGKDNLSSCEMVTTIPGGRMDLSGTGQMQGRGKREFFMAWRGPFTFARYTLAWSKDGELSHSLEYQKDGLPVAQTSTTLLPVLSASTEDHPTPLSVTLTLDRGVLTAVLDKFPPLPLFLGEEAGGACGILSPPSSPAAITPPGGERVILREIAPALPVASINEVFDQELLMKVWSGKAGEWRSSPGGARYDQVYWHRAFFYHDTELEANLPLPEETTLTKESILALSLCKNTGDTAPENGYVLHYRPREKSAPLLTLFRSGVQVAEASLDEKSAPRRILFRKAGSLLLASVDGRTRLTYMDSTPLVGPRVAWACRDYQVPSGNVSAINRNLLTYSFNSAPVDWVTGAGVWEVTNRWECDPRWSFWAGMPADVAAKRVKSLQKKLSPESAWKALNLKNQILLLPDPEEPHTVLWHKQGFQGDMVIEFFLGQMMDGDQGGTQYKNYVRDFNISFAADGENLMSGYSFIYGGWGNSRSAILRKEKIVAEVNQGIDLTSAHRRWLRLRVEKSGATITCSTYTTINPNEPDKQVLETLRFEDPDPLPGNRMAVWSYNCGILITRARISAEKILPAASPLAAPPAGRVESLYTLTPTK